MFCSSRKDKAVAGTVEDLNNYKATETSVDDIFVPNAKIVVNGNGDEIEMIVVDVRGYLKSMDKDIAVKAAYTHNVTNYDAANKTVTISANETAANIGDNFTNVLITSKIDDTHVVLISTKGDEMVVTVTGGTVTA